MAALGIKQPSTATTKESTEKKSQEVSQQPGSNTHDVFAQNEVPVDYPEGGLRAWGVVCGSWFALFGSMSFMNSIGTFQSYLSKNQLRDHTPASIGWIFGVYNGLTFLLGVQTGPIFDARGPRQLIACGGVLTVLYLMLLGVCDKYWHFMLVFGVVGGLSLSMIFGPAIAIVGHYFKGRRGLATGVASSGGAVGGIFFPLVLEKLFVAVGFAWATRIAGLICVATFTLAVVLLQPRFPPKPLTLSTVRPDLSIFRHGALTCTSLGVFFLEWGLFIPFAYLATYALDHGCSSQFAYMLLSLLNVGGIFGRWIPGYLADKIGRFNMLILTVLGCLVSLLCLWMPASSNKAILVAFSLVFGFFSGSNVSLAPVCVGQFCGIEAYGRYYSTAYILVSLSMFTGTAIGGELLQLSKNGYMALILFASGSYVASFAFLLAAKLIHKGIDGLWSIF